MWLKTFPVDYQMDSQDCGPACLKMIAKYYGRYHSLQSLRDKCGITKEGVSIKDLGVASESIGFRSLAIRCDLETIINRVPLPAIAYWEHSHFIVVYKTSNSHSEFLQGWLEDKNASQGILLCLEPTANFEESDTEKQQRRDTLWGILSYFKPYQRNFALIMLIMMLVTLMQALLPFIWIPTLSI